LAVSFLVSRPRHAGEVACTSILRLAVEDDKTRSASNRQGEIPVRSGYFENI